MEPIDTPVAPVADQSSPPAPPKPTIGRDVHYRLTTEQAAYINHHREYNPAHVGNAARPGDTCAAKVVAVWGPECVNLQVLLDGNDSLWVASADLGTGTGTWSWPPRV